MKLHDNGRFGACEKNYVIVICVITSPIVAQLLVNLCSNDRFYGGVQQRGLDTKVVVLNNVKHEYEIL